MKRLAWLLPALPPVLFTQLNTSAIGAPVYDSSQAVSNGGYSISALEPGACRLTLEKAGFKKLIREPLTLQGSSLMKQIDVLPLANQSAPRVFSARASFSDGDATRIVDGIRMPRTELDGALNHPTFAVYMRVANDVPVGRVNAIMEVTRGGTSDRHESRGLRRQATFGVL